MISVAESKGQVLNFCANNCTYMLVRVLLSARADGFVCIIMQIWA